MKIDLNSDLGEGFGAWHMGDDAALLQIVTSANVACGFHAGDPVVMDRTVREARANGVDLGAHVSFPDLAGFGRRPMQLEPRELELNVIYQLGALEGIARAAGHRVTHVNAHGALGNMACADRATADVLVRAVRAFDPSGQLVPRRQPGALVKAERDVLARVARVLEDRTLVTIEGETLKIEVDSILVHGDTPDAVGLARAIRALIASAGGELAPLSRR